MFNSFQASFISPLNFSITNIPLSPLVTLNQHNIRLIHSFSGILFFLSSPRSSLSQPSADFLNPQPSTILVTAFLSLSHSHFLSYSTTPFSRFLLALSSLLLLLQHLPFNFRSLLWLFFSVFHLFRFPFTGIWALNPKLCIVHLVTIPYLSLPFIKNIPNSYPILWQDLASSPPLG